MPYRRHSRDAHRLASLGASSGKDTVGAATDVILGCNGEDDQAPYTPNIEQLADVNMYLSCVWDPVRETAVPFRRCTVNVMRDHTVLVKISLRCCILWVVASLQTKMNPTPGLGERNTQSSLVDLPAVRKN